MKVEVVLYRADDMTALETYATEAPTWQGCVHDILSWLRIEVLPYWPHNSLRLSPCHGTHVEASAALYGIGLSYSMVEGEPYSPDIWGRHEQDKAAPAHLE